MSENFLNGWKEADFSQCGAFFNVCPRCQSIAAKVQESLAKANQVATETFSCMKTVRSFANEDGETEKYRRRLEDTYALNKKEAVAYAASTWASSVSLIRAASRNVALYAE